MLSVELDLKPWSEGIRSLRRTLNDELERAVRETSRGIRDEAKRSHSYQDRTGTLTRSIVMESTSGTFTRDTLEGGVIARAPYASFIEEGTVVDGTTRIRPYEYLATALVLQRDEIQANLDDALEKALWKAGL